MSDIPADRNTLNSMRALFPFFSLRCRPATATSVLTLLLLPTDLKSGSKVAASIDVTDDISALDFDDASGGFQSSFARLGASEAIKEDPVAYVTGDEKVYLKEELSKVAGGAVSYLFFFRLVCFQKRS